MNLIKAIKKLFVYGPIPLMLRWYCQGCEPGSFRYKLLPDCSCFPLKSVRRVYQNGLHLNLNLSDLVDWYTYFKVQEPAHDALMRLIKPGAVVFDIGANIGITALKSVQKTGVSGTVVAFEASPETFKRLLENCNANPDLSIRTINKAIGESPGFIDIHPRQPNNSGMNQVKEGSKIERIRLDDFVKESQLFPSVIKLDIEGYELKALRGAKKILNDLYPSLLVEIDRDNLGHFGDSPEELRDFLMELGYQFYRLDGSLFQVEEFAFIKHEDLIAKV